METTSDVTPLLRGPVCRSQHVTPTDLSSSSSSEAPPASPASEEPGLVDALLAHAQRAPYSGVTSMKRVLAVGDVRYRSDNMVANLQVFVHRFPIS